MSVAEELQTAIYAALAADGDLQGLVAGRIYDAPPPKPVFPYISFGPAASYDDDDACATATVETFQVDIWSRNHGQKSECKRIAAAVRAVLHHGALVLTSHSLNRVAITRHLILTERDNITVHGVIEVSANIEAAA